MSRDYSHLKLQLFHTPVPCASGMPECPKPHDAWNEEVELSMSRPSPKGFQVSSFQGAPGWLFFIEDYTTQLYRDYNKPF